MSHQTSAPVNQHLPANVAHLATARGMGPWLAHYPGKRLGWRLIPFAIFILGPLAGAVAAAAAGVWAAVAVLGLMGLGFLALALRAPNFNPRAAARHVYVFEQGMIETDTNGATDYRWDQIEWVTQAITIHRTNGIKTGTTYLYTVRRVDGKTTKITHFYDRIAQLGNTIADRVTDVQLPRAIDALRAGQTVTFGDLSLNMTGMASAGKGALPWTEIQKVTVNQGVVSVAKQGKWLSWSAKQARDIPNLFVFLALATRLAGGGNR